MFVNDDGSVAVVSSAGCPCDREPIAPPVHPSAAPLPRMQLRAILRDLDVCRDCGKSRVVLNAAPRHQAFKPETVSAATHCACVGGPAYAGIGGTL